MAGTCTGTLPPYATEGGTLFLNSSTTARGRIGAPMTRGDARPLSVRLRRRMIRLLGHLWDIHSRKSYSQEGEDMILARVFEGEGAVVAAEAVVTKSVSPWTVAAGNPTQAVREIAPEDR